MNSSSVMKKNLIKTSDSISTRVQNAKQFLLETPKESIVCAARIFNLAETTLYSSIEREKTPPKKLEGRTKYWRSIRSEPFTNSFDLWLRMAFNLLIKVFLLLLRL